MFLLLAASALAGYGDSSGGLPNPAERELHLWTNAVRVDPEAFKAEYPCDFDSFEEGEKTPKMPLLWNLDLTEAARFHSDDMQASGNFSHTSSDGTSFGSRLSRFYEGGFIGENIAWGYPSSWSAQIEGWMCSAGHRANIMTPDYEELGTGVTGVYYTQDFGSRGADTTANNIRMGAHSPLMVLTQLTLYADYYDAFGSGPTRIEAIVNGDPVPMSLIYGSPEQGVFTTTLTIDVGPCYTYWFRAERDDGRIVTFPETGAYGVGGCIFEDEEAQWLMRDRSDSPIGGEASDTGLLIHWSNGDVREWRRWPFSGCQHGGPPTTGWLFVLASLVLRRRR